MDSASVCANSSESDIVPFLSSICLGNTNFSVKEGGYGDYQEQTVFDASPSNSYGEGNHLRILLVYSQPELMRVTSAALLSQNYYLQCVDTPFSAYQLLSETHFDVALFSYISESLLKKIDVKCKRSNIFTRFVFIGEKEHYQESESMQRFFSKCLPADKLRDTQALLFTVEQLGAQSQYLRMSQERRLQLESLSYVNRTLSSFGSLALFYLDSRGLLQFVDKSFEDAFACKRKVCLGNSFVDYLELSDKQAFEEAQLCVLNSSQDQKNERTLDISIHLERLSQNPQNKGVTISREVALSPIFHDASECVVGILGIIQSRRVVDRQKQGVSDFISYDALTGIPCGTILKDRVQFFIATCNRNRQRLALFLVDISSIDANFSHDSMSGNQLFQLVVARLKKTLRSDDIVGCIEYRKLLVGLRDIKTNENAVIVVKKVIAALNECFELDSRQIYISPSIGVSMYPEHGGGYDELVVHADAALREANGEIFGINRYRVFSNVMHLSYFLRKNLMQEFKSAIEAKQLELEYQPIVKIVEGQYQVVSHDISVCWKHPDFGKLPLNSVKQDIKKSEDRLALDEFLCRQACRNYLSAYGGGACSKGAEKKFLSLNLTDTFIESSNFAQKLLFYLASEGVLPEQVWLNLPSEILFKEYTKLRYKLDILKAHGIRIVCTKLATMHVHLGYLHAIGPELIAVESSLHAGAKKEQEDFLHAFVALSKALSFRLLATGIDTEEQKTLFLEQDCLMQGNYICPSGSWRQMEIYEKKILLQESIEA